MLTATDAPPKVFMSDQRDNLMSERNRHQSEYDRAAELLKAAKISHAGPAGALFRSELLRTMTTALANILEMNARIRALR